MTKFLKLFMIAVFAVLSVSLVSCGDDNEDEPISTNELLGVWQDNTGGREFIICFQPENICSGIDSYTGFTGSYVVNETDKTISFNITMSDGNKFQSSTEYVLDGKSLEMTFNDNSIDCKYQHELVTESSLIGKWILENEREYPSFHIIEFKENGKAGVIYEAGEEVDNNVAWKFVDGKLRIYFDTDINYDDYLEGTIIMTDDVLLYMCDYSTGDGIATTPFRLKRV